MQRIICRAKIHGATVTEANLEYMGSITIDEALLRAADILPAERVQVVNMQNGKRLETYCIPGKADSGVICLNGPAAHCGNPGDIVHILSYAVFEEGEAKGKFPRIIFLDRNNKVKK